MHSDEFTFASWLGRLPGSIARRDQLELEAPAQAPQPRPRLLPSIAPEAEQDSS